MVDFNDLELTLEKYYFCDIGQHAGKFHVTLTAYVTPEQLAALGG